MTSREIDDAHILALALIEDPERTQAIIRAAYTWGYGRGWANGFDRSFAPSGWRANVPSFAEVCRRRGEIPNGDGTCRTVARDADYLGGPIASTPAAPGRGTAA